jgi:hypothetical protein
VLSVGAGLDSSVAAQWEGMDEQDYDMLLGEEEEHQQQFDGGGGGES